MRSLTDYENMVLVTLVKQHKLRYWAEPPRNNEMVSAALRTLSAHRMIVHKAGEWWLVRPTDKALKHVENRKKGDIRMKGQPRLRRVNA